MHLPGELGNRVAEFALKMKTPPTSEDIDGVFHALTFFKVAALEWLTFERPMCSGHIAIL